MINSPPFDAHIVNTDRYASKTFSEWLALVHLAADSVTQSGTTAQRPTKNLWVGRMYYDTTLGLPIWVHQVTPTVVWHKADGTVP